jgi:enoyl-CoA hydratase/carnithine racemase
MLDIGFLTEIVPADQLMARVDALAQTLAGMAPIPLLGMKKHLNRIAHGTLDVLDLERDELLSQMSEDLKEGGLAWKEKRKPVFRGV